MPKSSPRTGGAKRPSAGRRTRAAGNAGVARRASIAQRPAAATKAVAGGKPGAAKRPAPARKESSALPEWAPARVSDLIARLKRLHPDAKCSLEHVHPLQLLVATILSAQCTDDRVNMVTPGLFERFPDAAALSRAGRPELEDVIRSTGFFRSKARSIQECCRDLVEKHGGQVPRTMEELTALRGVGRKTANVVLGNAYGIPGVVVDTHVGRLSRRLGLTSNDDPVKVELDLMARLPREEWTLFSHLLIHHGRRVCPSRKPHCSRCALADLCPRSGVEESD
ncbi:MAG: endonuclease III [Candidatus Eisenbacteria bacterium]|nr:endonuclease III [Candidatus Eisenbacteria bacterium]